MVGFLTCFHKSTGCRKVENLSTKIKMWKCGKLTIRLKANDNFVENSKMWKSSYKTNVNYFIIGDTK